MNGLKFRILTFVVIWHPDCSAEDPLDTWTSTDGGNWVWRQPRGDAILRGFPYGNGHFVAVGHGGTILESRSIITLAITPQFGTGLLSLTLEGPTGLAYTIESSTNLTSWQTLTNFTSAQPTTMISDSIPATSEPLFYRAYSQ